MVVVVGPVSVYPYVSPAVWVFVTVIFVYGTVCVRVEGYHSLCASVFMTVYFFPCKTECLCVWELQSVPVYVSHPRLSVPGVRLP